MKFTDLIELAKKGYTPKDVRELLAMSDDHKESTDEETTEEAPEAENQTHEEAPENDPAGEGETPAGDGADDSEEVKRLKKEIERLQAANTRRERPEPEKKKTVQEIFEDYARQFM